MSLRSRNVASWITVLFNRKEAFYTGCDLESDSSMCISTLKTLVWIGIIGYVVSVSRIESVGFTRTMYGECVKTCGEAPPLRVFFMSRHCVRDGKCSYCKYFGCPVVECFKKGRKVVPNLTPDRRCLTCEGQCVYGAEIYKKGDKFMAADDLNSCKCVSQGRIICTMKKRKPSISGFCDV